jgi:hypothetical protein
MRTCFIALGFFSVACGSDSNKTTAHASSPADSGAKGPSMPLAGCDDSRHATAHNAGAKVIDPAPAGAPLVCGTETNMPSVNAALVVDDAGAVLFAPAGQNTLARSTDNGATWENLNPDGADTGRVFFNAFALGTGASGCTKQTGADLWSSDQLNAPFTHVSVGCDSFDWGKMITGPAVTEASKQALAANGYPNVVYYCATGPALIVGPNRMCYRSVDGGATFVRTGADAVDSARGQRGWPNQGAVGPDGTLYASHPSDMGVAISVSHDEGDGWVDVHVTGSVFTGPTSSWLGSNVATDSNGNLYATWVDDRDRLPYLSVSKDQGSTWSTPLMIALPDVRVSNYPNISVKKPGYVAVAYYGSSDATGNGSDGYFNDDGRAWNAYLAVTTDVFAANPMFWSGVFTDSTSPAIDGLSWPKSEDLGPPAFAPDGSVWAAFVHEQKGLAGRLTPPP